LFVLSIGHFFSTSTPRNTFLSPYDCIVNARTYILKNSFVEYRVPFDEYLYSTRYKFMRWVCSLLLMLGNRNFFWYTKNICTMCSVSYFRSNASESGSLIHYCVWTQRTYPRQQRNATSIINQIYEIIILRFREVSYIKCIIVYFSVSLLFLCFFLAAALHSRILKNFTRSDI
jgi:hypothetical protein